MISTTVHPEAGCSTRTLSAQSVSRTCKVQHQMACPTGLAFLRGTVPCKEPPRAIYRTIRLGMPRNRCTTLSGSQMLMPVRSTALVPSPQHSAFMRVVLRPVACTQDGSVFVQYIIRDHVGLAALAFYFWRATRQPCLGRPQDRPLALPQALPEFF